MSVAEFQERSAQISSLLHSMTVFIKSPHTPKETQRLKETVSRWMAVLFDGYVGSGEGDIAIENWDLDDNQIQHEIQDLVDAADKLPFDIWGDSKKYLYRLLSDFGNAEVRSSLL